MKYAPLPTQLAGAEFLAARRFGLLADAPRVGKTGAAIIAADYLLADRLLIVTTASGRAVWKRGLADWSVFPRDPQVVTPSNVSSLLSSSGRTPAFEAGDPGSTPGRRTNCFIVGWPSIADPKVRASLMRVEWDLVILDESHNAKNHEAKRTQAIYGDFLKDGAHLDATTAIIGKARAVWCLTGTPLPHSPADAYPMLRALAPDRLAADAAQDWPDVSAHSDFLHRYCVVRMKKLSRFNSIKVIIGGKNLPELRARLEGFLLRRTQEDVGIRPPVYELLPLIVSDKMKRAAEGSLDAGRVLAAAEAGDTKALEMHLGPLRRLTGEIKARAVVDAVKDEFAGGLDKIVLMYWHKDVGQILKEGLASYGVAGIDGSTPDAQRGAAVTSFADPKGARVFLGQVVAAGEAIDLSAASTLWFVEMSFSPKDAAQASLRITNIEQRRQAVVKVVTLEGSIDEAVQARLLSLWTSITEVLAK